MKKNFTLLVALLLFSLARGATYTLNPTATGYATSSGATSGDITVTNSANRGYATFNIAALSLPAGTIITSVTLNFQISAVSGAGTPTCTVYGYNGDISTLSSSSIYAACTTSTSTIYTATWGTTAVSRTMATTAAADTLIARALSGKISMCWVLSASTRAYSINGTTTPVPVLTITTCNAPTAVSITATPNPVCSGSSLALTGAATSGSTYSWTGPAGFSSTALNPAAFTAGTVSAGVYTFVATSACGTAAAPVTKLIYVGTSAPSAISGATRICGASGVSTTLTNTTSGGIWTSSAPANATIDINTGVLTSVSTGATTITYNTGCGTATTLVVTVSANPNVVVNNASGSACYGATVSVTASGANTYRWSPSAGLSTTTLATVVASPTTTTVYTVTGTTTSTGCTNTATTTITGSPSGNPFTVAAVASPTLTCTGGSTTLIPSLTNTIYNTVTSIPYSPVSTAGTSVMAGDDDNNISVALPFTFYYYGNAVTSVSICTNGFINLGTPTIDLSSYSLPDPSAPEGLITLFMHDLDLGAGGNIKYQTLGLTPNRQFVVSYNAVSDYGGYTTNTGQIILYETSNNIDILIGSCSGSTSGFTMTTGIQDLTGSAGLMPPGRDNTNFDASNEAWRFTGLPTSGYLYSWTPSAILSSSTSANPVASPISGATTFTVTVSDSTTGCYKATTASVVTGTLSGTISPNTTVCSGSTASVVFNGPGSGTATYTINGGSPITVALSAAGTATVTTAAITSRTIYSLISVGSGSCSQAISGQEDTISVVSPPSLTVSRSATTYCHTAGILISASGTATSYTWSPSVGLTATTGASVTASPSINTVYTVTASIGACSSYSTAAINVAAPFTAAAVATPTITCVGGSSTLSTVLTNTYYNTVTSIPYAAVSTAGTSVLAGEDDNFTNVPIPFTFYFYGNGYDNVNICSNGFINFGASATDFSALSLPDGSAPAGIVALFWQDLYVYSGTIKYQTLGSAPYRKFVVSYNAVPDLGGYGNHTGQIIMYETYNYIDLLINSNPASYNPVTCGVQDLTGSNGIAAPGRNGVAFSATSEAWRFTGVPTSGYSYSWLPATGLSSSTSGSPTASSISSSTTYTATVTETATGCADTAITVVNTGTLPGTISAADTICSSSATNVTFNGPGGATATYTINGGSPLTVTLDASGVAVVSTGTITATTTYQLTTITSGSCVQTITGQTRTIYVRPAAGTISGTSSLCVGATYTFTNPTAGGTWTTSVATRASVSSSGVVNGIAVGSVVISYALGSCPAATFNLTVINTPAAITPAAAVSICAGTSTTLASTTTGGVWTTSSAAIATVDSATGIVIGISAGSVTITYGNACGNRTKTITVNTSPASITGTSLGLPISAICTLSSYTFTDSVSGGTWSNSPTTVGTIGSSTGTFNSGTATGTTTISYAIGSCVATRTLNVGSTPPASISGATSVCALATTTLTDATASGVWSSSSLAVASVEPTTGVVHGIDNGTATISYSNGCGTPATASMTVNGSIPVLYADTICSGTTLNLHASVAATGTYSWAGPSSFTSTALSPSISSASTARAGTYILTVTSTVGSCVTSGRLFAVVDTLPSASRSVSPSSICPGSTATLTDVVTAPTGLTMHAIPYTRVAVPLGTAGPSGDDAQTNVTIPFTFNYMGTNYTTVRICTNGFINFGAASTLYISEAIPSSTAPPGMVALFWQDLNAAAGDIRYTTLGTSPNRRFVVSFNSVPDISGSTTSTGQIVLYETSNMIDLYVSSTNSTFYQTPVCGIQNQTGSFALVANGENATSYDVASPGEGWRFITPSYNYTWSPATSLLSTTGTTVVSSGLSSTQVYTVTARDIYSYCGGNIATSTVNVTPMTSYTVTGGNGCTATGVSVGLSSSDVGTSYQLYRSGSTVGSSVSGTGSALSFGTQTTAGNYNVIATRGGCSATMNGGDTIRSTPSITIGTSPAICQPATSGVVTYTGASGSPTTYNIAWAAAAVTAGFSNVSGASLGASVTLSAPGSVTGSYSGSLTVSNGSCSSAVYAVGIDIYAAPSGAITSAVPPCSGYSTNVVITGTPGASLSYRIDGSTLVTTTIPGGGVYNLSTGAITSSHTYLLHSIYNPACSNTYDTTATVNPVPMQWVGGNFGHEHDWNTNANWSCGFVPGASDNVTIPVVTYDPVIGASAAGTTGNLTLDSAASITVNASGSLNVKGNLASRGTIKGQGLTIMNGSAAQTISGIGSIGNFQLNNTGGATIASASRLTVDSVLTISADTLHTSDSLVLGADSAHTARLAPIAGTGYVVGQARVMQAIQSGYRRYRFWSHPFQDVIPFSQMQNYVDLTGAGGASNGFTATMTNAPSVYRYTTLAGNSTLSYDPGWKPVTSALATAGDSNKIARYQGVRVYLRGAKGEGLGFGTYTPSATAIGQWGHMNQGRQLVSLVKGSSAGQDYNLLGNPYASPVDIGTVVFNAKTSGNIIGSYYIWNPTLGTGGQFTTYPIGTVSATPYYISASTAFEVRAAHNGDSLVFNESNKGTAPSANLLRTLPEYTSLRIYDESYHLFDMLDIKFDNSTTDGQDNVNDAEKLMGGDLNFYSLSADGKRQAIDVRPYAPATAIPLGIESQVAQAFIIRAENVVLPDGGQLFLHDKLLHTYTPLVQGAEYKFSITKDAATQGKERFEIGMKPAVASNPGAFDVNVTPNPASNEVRVTFSSTISAETSVRLTDMNGVTLFNKSLGIQQGGTVAIPVQKLASGIYLVELTSGDRKVTRRLVKE